MTHPTRSDNSPVGDEWYQVLLKNKKATKLKSNKPIGKKEKNEYSCQYVFYSFSEKEREWVRQQKIWERQNKKIWEKERKAKWMRETDRQ